MTTDQKLMIALISSTFISQLIAPLMPALMKSRKSQPSASPEANHRQYRKRVIFWMVLVAVSVCMILFNVGLLVWEVRRPTPLTRASVLNIALAVGGLVCIINNLSLAHAEFLLRSEIRSTLSLIEKLVERLTALDVKPPQPNPFDKLLSAVRDLLGR